MYGRSIKNSGLFYNVDTDENIPYNNDRLDDAVSLDYSQALGGAIRDTSGTYASKIIPNSSARQNGDREASGIYATRIASSRQQTTSTPEPPPRRHSNAGSGNYAQSIGNLKRSQSDRFYNKHENESNVSNGMDRPLNTVFRGQIGMNSLGNTVYRGQILNDRHDRYHPPPIMEDDIGLQGLDSPRSTQWPETARSYPLGFDASHVASNAPHLETVGETSDSGSHNKRKIHRETSKKKKIQHNRNSSDLQTPPWANQLLDKNSSLVGKFQNIKDQINKWTLRRFSQRARIPYTDQGPFEMLDFEPVVNAESVSSLLPKQQDKTNNLALFLFGLFFIFILVFPVIVIIVLFTDRSDLVQIELSMKLNGSITENFKSGIVEYNLCNQIDLAVASYNGFYGCNVNEFRNGSIIADVSLLFRVANYPNKILLANKIEEQFANIVIDTVITTYSFVKSGLVSVPSYLRQLTTTEVQTTPEVTTRTTMQITTSTATEPTTTKSLSSTITFTTTSIEAPTTTTEPPTTTTEPPTTTTKSPTTTTESPTTTTESPTTTTESPTTTTETPTTTTESPTTTTESPTTTTELLTATTETPITTTEPPTTTTESPTTTTKPPITPTESPTTSTEPPTTTTESPITPTESPTTSTEPPTTTTESPTTTTEPPTTSTDPPTTTDPSRTTDPNASTTKSITTTTESLPTTTESSTSDPSP